MESAAAVVATEVEFLQLGDDLHLSILCQLDGTDVFRFGRVSKHFWHMSHDIRIWKHVLYQKWRLTEKPSDWSWRRFYKWMYVEIYQNSIWCDSDMLSLDLIAPSNGRLRAGTLNKLIINLTPDICTNTSSYLRFVKTFLLTYRSFTNPALVCAKLGERFQLPQPTPNGVDADLLRLRVCNVLKQWIWGLNTLYEMCEATVAGLKHVLLDVILPSNRCVKIAKKCVNELNRRVSQIAIRYTITLQGTAPKPVLPDNFEFWVSNNLFELSPVEVARQICLIDSRQYQSIKVSELLQQNWRMNRNNSRARKTEEEEIPHNVFAVTRFFNQLSLWVAGSIVYAQHDHQRLQRLDYFIQLADHLCYCNNFNSMTAIIAGLSSASVIKLKHVWSLLNPIQHERLDAMRQIMSPSGSFKYYRQELHLAEPPLVPYLGVYLSDITYVENANPDYIGHDLINFSKRQLLCDVVEEVQQYQHSYYNFVAVPDIQTALQSRSLVGAWCWEDLYRDAVSVCTAAATATAATATTDSSLYNCNSSTGFTCLMMESRRNSNPDSFDSISADLDLSQCSA